MNVGMTSDDKGINDVHGPTQREVDVLLGSFIFHVPSENSSRCCGQRKAPLIQVKCHTAHPNQTGAISFVAQILSDIMLPS